MVPTRFAVASILLLTLQLGCGGGSSSGPTPVATPVLTVTDIPSNYLTTPTYDGGGQAVEPDVLFIPSGWNGYKYWMTAAPYTDANDKLENASIWATNDAPGANQTWVVPPGVTNPVVGVPPTGFIDSDQSIFLDTDGTMYLYYSQQTSDLKSKIIYVISSKDGWKTITKPIALFHTLTATSNPLVSTALKDPTSGLYYLWQVDIATPAHPFYRWQSTSPTGPFTNQTKCVLNGLPGTFTLWEHNIIRSPDGSHLLALSTLAAPGNPFPPRGGTQLNFLSSADGGLTWTVQPTPIIPLGAKGTWDSLQIYRGSLEPTLATMNGQANTYDIWYSGASPAEVWHIAYASATITP